MLRLHNFYVSFVYLVLNGLSTSSPSDSTSIIFLVSFHEFPNNFLRCLYHEKIGRQMFFPELCRRDADREVGKKISREKQSRLLACIFEADYGNVRSAIVCVYIYVHICVYVGRARISSFLGNHGPEVTRKIISPKTGYTGSIYAIEHRVASRRVASWRTDTRQLQGAEFNKFCESRRKNRGLWWNFKLVRSKRGVTNFHVTLDTE